MQMTRLVGLVFDKRPCDVGGKGGRFILIIFYLIVNNFAHMETEKKPFYHVKQTKPQVRWRKSYA